MQEAVSTVVIKILLISKKFISTLYSFLIILRRQILCIFISLKKSKIS